MQHTSQAKYTSSSERMFQAVMLTFIVCVLVAIGAVVLNYRNRVEHQKALYAQYKVMNAWRPSAAAQYAMLLPCLERLERINLSRPEDWKDIEANYQRFEKLRDAFMASIGSSQTGGLLRDASGPAFYRYKAIYNRARIQLRMERDPRVNEEARIAVVFIVKKRLQDDHDPLIPKPRGEVFLREAKRLVGEMSDLEVRERILPPGEFKETVDRCREGREFVQNILAYREDIPAGLDLEFAKRVSE